VLAIITIQLSVGVPMATHVEIVPVACDLYQLHSMTTGPTNLFSGEARMTIDVPFP
jgi:hypothetical protein